MVDRKGIKGSKRGVLEDWRTLVSSLFRGWIVVPVPETGNTGRGPGLDGPDGKFNFGHYKNWKQKV